MQVAAIPLHLVPLATLRGLELPCLSSAPLEVRLVPCNLRAMKAGWTPTFAGDRVPASFLVAFFLSFRVYVLLRKTRQQRLHEDGVRFFPPSLHPGGASSIRVRGTEHFTWLTKRLSSDFLIG